MTYPVLEAHARRGIRPAVLHIDAHADLYDVFDDNRLSHACPFARIMESGLATRLVQVGIRTLNQHQREQAARFGVEIVEMRAWSPSLELSFDEPVYVSLDLDALDPAYAPGVSHHEPGGLSTRDVIGLLQRVQGRVIGADVVELNPARDLHGVTAMVAARFVKELVAACSHNSGREDILIFMRIGSPVAAETGHYLHRIIQVGRIFSGS